MARLSKSSLVNPHSWAFDESKHNEWEAKVLAASEAACLANPVGFLVKFPWADSYALYRVQKAEPLTLQHVATGDAWKVPAAYTRGYRKEDLAKDIRQRDAWRTLLLERQAKKANA